MKQSASFQGLNIDKNSIINLEKGKLPPQAIELEEVVLGAMMIDKKGVDEVIDILNDDATLNKHGLEFEGKDRFIARKEIIEKNNLKKIISNSKTINIC